MNIKIPLFITVLFLTLAAGCREAHQKEDYTPLLKALHQIECEELNKWRVEFSINDTNIYTFRGIAFDKIMTKEPDAKRIAYYEELNQKLAVMEYFMDDEEKVIYRDDFRKEYLRPCAK